VFDKPSDLVAKLEDLFTVEFKAEEIQNREKFFQKYYSNIDSGRTIVKNIYSNKGQDVDLL
jgi:acyl carrier protein